MTSFSGKKNQNDRKTEGGVAFQKNLEFLEFLEF